METYRFRIVFINNLKNLCNLRNLWIKRRIPGETDSQLEPACSRSFRDGGLRDLPERYEEHRKENRPDRTRRRTAVGHDRPEDYHTELLKQFSDNPSFKKWLGDTILAVTYTQATNRNGRCAVRILAIEDDRQTMQFMARGLRQEAFAVDCSSDGEETVCILS
jgi:hypothetical protein